MQPAAVGAITWRPTQRPRYVTDKNIYMCVCACVTPVHLGFRDGREQSSTYTRSASAVTSAVIRPLPNAPRTYRYGRTLDPARESCRPTFVHTELLRSVRWSSNSGPAKIVQDQSEGRVSPIPLVLGCAGIGSKGVLEM